MLCERRTALLSRLLRRDGSGEPSYEQDVSCDCTRKRMLRRPVAKRTDSLTDYAA